MNMIKALKEHFYFYNVFSNFSFLRGCVNWKRWIVCMGLKVTTLSRQISGETTRPVLPTVTVLVTALETGVTRLRDLLRSSDATIIARPHALLSIREVLVLKDPSFSPFRSTLYDRKFYRVVGTPYHKSKDGVTNPDSKNVIRVLKFFLDIHITLCRVLKWRKILFFFFFWTCRNLCSVTL